MKNTIRFAALGALSTAAWLLLGTPNLTAQDAPPQGGFDPAQMRQQMLEHIRSDLEVTDDSEWSALSGLITKVLDARRAAGVFRGPPPGGFPGGPGGPPPSGDQGAGNPPPPGGPAGFRPPPSPELEALQSAIQANASASELKEKIAAVQAARAKHRAELEQAQAGLRQVLTARQEAIATTLGLL